MSDFATVTVLREDPQRPVKFLTVVVDLWEEVVVDGLDEEGVAIALTPKEEHFAVRIALMGLDETGR